MRVDDAAVPGAAILRVELKSASGLDAVPTDLPVHLVKTGD